MDKLEVGTAVQANASYAEALAKTNAMYMSKHFLRHAKRCFL